jgi:hypothetical protein
MFVRLFYIFNRTSNIFDPLLDPAAAEDSGVVGRFVTNDGLAGRDCKLWFVEDDVQAAVGENRHGGGLS